MTRSARLAIWISVGAVVVGVLVVAAVFALLYGKTIRFSVDLPQTMGKARRLGLPMRLADLQPQPPVIASENAAPLIWRACKAPLCSKANRKVLDDLRASVRSRLGKPTPADIARVARLRDLSDVALQAAAKPRCDFGYDYDLGRSILLPETSALKSMTQALSFRAAVEARTGRKPEAMRDLRAALVLGRHAGACRTMIGALVEIACDFIAIDAAERVATAWADDPKALADIGSALDALPALPDPAGVIKAEFYLSLAVCRNLDLQERLEPLVEADEKARRGAGPPPDKSFLVRDGLPDDPAVQAVMDRMASCWVRLYEAVGRGKSMLKIAETMDRIADEEESKGGLDPKLREDLCPRLGRACRIYVTLEAHRVCLHALVRVLEYRALHRAFPKSLAEAGVKETDPFDGKPLRYTVANGVCKVYSVGPDLRDEGGLDRRDLPKGSDGESGWDVVARYPAHLSKK